MDEINGTIIAKVNWAKTTPNTLPVVGYIFFTRALRVGQAV